MKITENDKRYMRLCFSLAKRGEGMVSPNPLVGSVIIKNDKIVSEGWHEKFGEKHAEANAIENANESLTGATLYCNLEPCCHTHKKTPPCAPLIINSGIKKVVISNIDPNSEVAGKGIEMMKNAGIDTTIGVLENEGRQLNRFFFKYITTKLPFVTVKIAQSKDGFITREPGIKTWLTGEKAGEFVHELRSQMDVVLVGANTVKIDNPDLSVRHVEGRDPIKVIIDGNLSCPINAKIFSPKLKKKTWIFTSKNSDKEKMLLLRNAGIKIFELVPLVENELDIHEVLKILGENGVSSVLVEGGSQIFNNFVFKTLFDELIIIETPKYLKHGLKALEVDFKEKTVLFNKKFLGNDVASFYANKTKLL